MNKELIELLNQLTHYEKSLVISLIKGLIKGKQCISEEQSLKDLLSQSQGF